MKRRHAFNLPNKVYKASPDKCKTFMDSSWHNCDNYNQSMLETNAFYLFDKAIYNLFKRLMQVFKCFAYLFKKICICLTL